MDKDTKKRLKRQGLKESLINVVGNTAGVWLTFLIIGLFYNGIISTSWQGLNYFVFDGTLLIITYSFLTSIFIASVKSYELNRYSICAILLFVLTSIFYARHLGLGGIEKIDATKWNFQLWVPFLLSIILLVFATQKDKIDKNQSNWQRKKTPSKKENNSYSIFISYAIAAAKSPTKRNEIKEQIKLIEKKLKALGYTPVFNADNHKLPNDQFQTPSAAADLDFNAIENSKNFILYYPEATPTSAILELGYALRDEDNIVIFTPNIKILPYLVRGLPEISNKVRIVEYENTDHILNLIDSSHESYFIK